MFDTLMLILFVALLIGKLAGWFLIGWWIVFLPLILFVIAQVLEIIIIEILLHLGGK